MSARDDFSIQSLLGHDSFVRGNLKTQGLTRIDGSIDGNVEIDGTVIMGDECKVRGNIKAGSVTLLGSIVQGNIESSGKVRLTKGAVVLGDMSAKNVYMEEGCVLNGHCIVLQDENEMNAAREERDREDALRAAVRTRADAAGAPPDATPELKGAEPKTGAQDGAATDAGEDLFDDDTDL